MKPQVLCRCVSTCWCVMVAHFLADENPPGFEEGVKFNEIYSLMNCLALCK